MGDRAPALIAVASLALTLSACGDAIIVIGDAPGLVRIAIGIPDAPGDGIGARGTESQLATPLGIAADQNGNVYIADSQNSRILGVTSSGIVNTFLNHSQKAQEPRLREPSDVALDGQGNLLVADPRGHRIWQIDLVGIDATVVAGTGLRGNAPDSIPAASADLDAPTGIAVDPNGVIHFSEPALNRIRRIESDGTLTTFAGTGQLGSDDGVPANQARFNRPTGLAFGQGVLYIADTGNHKVRRVDLSSRIVSTVAGNGVRGFSGDGDLAISARLDGPRELALSSDGMVLFIADSGNHRVRFLNFGNNQIATLVGTGETAFNGDLLSAGQTALSEPEGVAISALDILYIADTGHHLVRRTPVGFLVAP